ncbi:MAG: aconitase X [Candidatus Promineifilaceae bacterium]
MTTNISLNREQRAMLAGKKGAAKQTAMRLLLDLAAAAGATALLPVRSAHLSGVSPLTGGYGLRHFLTRLAEDPLAQVNVPTTLNAAGCDADQFDLMRITVPDFLAHSQEIVGLYTKLGVQPTQSCIPYEWEGVIAEGTAAWSESNAICFANSYCGLMTNRESGLSALASALTGYTPQYGLLVDEARKPNLEVNVTCELKDPTDFSVLGDWIGKQRQSSWRMPFGPIPLIKGLPAILDHEQRKALTAAAANYGSPLVYLDGHSELPEPGPIQASLQFGKVELERRYDELKPRTDISLITIGCPQASVGEIRMAAHLLEGKKVASSPDDGSGLPPLWIFTSSANKAIAEKIGLAAIILESGGLLLENTCPEVVPYDRRWVKSILTNSMKAEHYLQSGLNNIPTSVMRLADCIAVATGELVFEADQDRASPVNGSESKPSEVRKEAGKGPVFVSDGEDSSRATNSYYGQGLPSQGNFSIVAEAFVTDVPITFLGFVDRQSGVVREPGHPADGQSMAGKIAIFPKGTGSSVAPYVLLELFYRGMAPLAIANTEIDQQTAPACSLENIPYAFGFDPDLFENLQNGDQVELTRRNDGVELRLLKTV